MRAIMLATLVLGVAISAAQANDVVEVTWRKAQVMSFGSGVAGIVIGDPSIIDVTVEGSGQVVVFGKVPGETNIIVMGADNSVLFSAPVVVMPETDRHVSIISAGGNTINERSWNCLSRCVQVIGPGGTTYASVSPVGGGGSAPAGAAGAGAPDQAAAAAAGQTAQDVANGNSSIAKGASGVGGPVIVPY